VGCRGDKTLAKIFKDSYVEAIGGQRPSWLAPRGSLPVSHVAVLYTLLHEQDALPRTFKLFPQLWDDLTLDAFAEEIYGWLDDEQI
jgi:hypothetical protein